MSSSSLISIFIFIFISLISPAHSTCTSQKLPPHRTYTNCTDLPALGATLHFTYNSTNHTIAVAFSAAPSTTEGWVSWGINPTGGGMVGTQALIAYKTNGKIGVHLYNLTSYEGINAVKKLSVETSDLSAEESNGVITIFAVVKLPEKADNISQVWQVGPVMKDLPMKHDFKPENLKAKLALNVVGSTDVSNSTSGGANSTAPSPAVNEKSGGVRFEKFGFGFYFGFVLLFLSLITM